ncbi:hypothetical protein PC9H_004616 [Pleurotus ostreatus]|uniref:Uncharacterized protein n=1 Tax=Pleurotus ostreatus TaxID=5322 RepID=A0A8H6ZXK2_PLEOS|nr:uncharacterized protein PC9H_004616 [Pleurotus ostreatus]KAF7432674.1 hypothetical protein PC9H_004616 [Pleurotus ostreatus]
MLALFSYTSARHICGSSSQRMVSETNWIRKALVIQRKLNVRHRLGDAREMVQALREVNGEQSGGIEMNLIVGAEKMFRIFKEAEDRAEAAEQAASTEKVEQWKVHID